MAYGTQALLNDMRNERIDRKSSKAFKSLCGDNRQAIIDDETLRMMKLKVNDLDTMCIESRLGAGLTRLIMR